MKSLYIEVLATHDGPEPCVGRAQGRRRSVGRVHAGWAMEPRNQCSGVPTPLNQVEGNTVGGVIASRRRAPRGL
jgi:hypothetical protein